MHGAINMKFIVQIILYSVGHCHRPQCVVVAVIIIYFSNKYNV